ncbi:hypothetical protein [Rhizobium rhizophilum]|uniref:Universal stress protein n=1 Tax=Rhizobium rhizophilum TaxID=1850373 RepID=A0ABY2QRQ0_9HYPH|nr:hypothetical protein [Rhizobium rhizophilum]THV12691.1 hypothetical protein E9677_18365 [Rhizobium rhizophilum]
MVAVQTRILIVVDGGDSVAAPDKELARAVARIYFSIRHADLEPVLACEGGGFPIVAADMRRFAKDPGIAPFLQDPVARSEIADTLPIEHIIVEDFDAAVFFPSEGDRLGAALALKQTFLETGKPIAILESWSLAKLPRKFVIISSPTCDVTWLDKLLR